MNTMNFQSTLAGLSSTDVLSTACPPMHMQARDQSPGSRELQRGFKSTRAAFALMGGLIHASFDHQPAPTERVWTRGEASPRYYDDYQIDTDITSVEAVLSTNMSARTLLKELPRLVAEVYGTAKLFLSVDVDPETGIEHLVITIRSAIDDLEERSRLETDLFQYIEQNDTLLDALRVAIIMQG